MKTFKTRYFVPYSNGKIDYSLVKSQSIVTARNDIMEDLVRDYKINNPEKFIIDTKAL